MKSKNLMSTLGFLFFILGFISLALSLIGLQFQFLLWMDHFGSGAGFLLRILMILAGFILIYLARFNWEENEKEPEIE